MKCGGTAETKATHTPVPALSPVVIPLRRYTPTPKHVRTPAAVSMLLFAGCCLQDRLPCGCVSQGVEPILSLWAGRGKGDCGQGASKYNCEKIRKMRKNCGSVTKHPEASKSNTSDPHPPTTTMAPFGTVLCPYYTHQSLVCAYGCPSFLTGVDSPSDPASVHPTPQVRPMGPIGCPPPQKRESPLPTPEHTWAAPDLWEQQVLPELHMGPHYPLMDDGHTGIPPVHRLVNSPHSPVMLRSRSRAGIRSAKQSRI